VTYFESTNIVHLFIVHLYSLLVKYMWTCFDLSDFHRRADDTV